MLIGGRNDGSENLETQERWLLSERRKRGVYMIFQYYSTWKQAFRVGREPGQSHVDLSFVAVMVVVGGDIPLIATALAAKFSVAR